MRKTRDRKASIQDANNKTRKATSRIRMEYNPVSKSAAGDMVLTHSPAIDAVQYNELLTIFTGAEPITGIHKTIYDNLNGIKTGLLLNAYNDNSELDARYSDFFRFGTFRQLYVKWNTPLHHCTF
jgi:hypothetical protein